MEQLNDYIEEIKINGLPSIFPHIDYTDKTTLYNRFVRLGTHEKLKVLTSTSHTTTDDDKTTERNVLTVSYPFFEFQIHHNEKANIENIGLAEIIEIRLVNDPTDEYRRFEIINKITRDQKGNSFNIVSTIQVIELLEDVFAVSKFLIAENLRSAEEGKYADTELCQLIISADTEAGGAKIQGNKILTSYDFSADNKDFKILDDSVVSVQTITLDTNCATTAAIITHINAKLTAAGVTDTVAYQNEVFIGFKSVENLSTKSIELQAGTTDDALVLFGILPDTYIGGFAIDNDFETIDNVYKLYTKLMPFTRQIAVTETENYEESGLKKISDSFVYNCLKATFFVTEEEFNNIQKWIRKCYYDNNKGCLFWSPTEKKYRAINPIDPKISIDEKMKSYDCYKFEIELLYDTEETAATPPTNAS